MVMKRSSSIIAVCCKCREIEAKELVLFFNTYVQFEFLRFRSFHRVFIVKAYFTIYIGQVFELLEIVIKSTVYVS